MGTRDVTLTTLRTQIRRLTDTESDAHIADAELTDWINEARAEVFDILRRADPDFYEKTATISTSADTYQYALPTDYYDTKGVEWLSTASVYEALKRIDFRERLQYQTPSGTSAGYSEAYRIAGAYVELYPTPPASQTYRHIYIPVPALLSGASDVVDGREAELIREKVSIWIKRKQDLDTSVAERQFEREVSRLASMTDTRTPREPDVVADVESYSRVNDWIRKLPKARY